MPVLLRSKFGRAVFFACYICHLVTQGAWPVLPRAFTERLTNLTNVMKGNAWHSSRVKVNTVGLEPSKRCPPGPFPWVIGEVRSARKPRTTARLSVCRLRCRRQNLCTFSPFLHTSASLSIS